MIGAGAAEDKGDCSKASDTAGVPSCQFNIVSDVQARVLLQVAATDIGVHSQKPYLFEVQAAVFVPPVLLLLYRVTSPPA